MQNLNMQMQRAEARGVLRGCVRLCRLSNSGSAAIVVLVGAYLSTGWPLPPAAWWAAAAMWCVTAFGYVSNDCLDIVEDAVNKPDRPLPSGQVSRASALRLAIMLAIAAILVSATLGLLPLMVALGVLVLLMVYNTRLKSTVVAGNLFIGVLAGGALLTGGVAARGFRWEVLATLWLPATLLALFIAAREVLKTVEDIAGDSAASKQTLAAIWGTERALQIFALLAVLLLLFTTYTYWVMGHSTAYLCIMVLGVVGPLFYTLLYLRKDAAPPRTARCLRLLKGSYFAGILALLFLVG